MERPAFPSHFDPRTNKYQTNRDHLLGTAQETESRSCAGLSPALLRITALIHDCGKYSWEWADYFASSIDGSIHYKLDHATAGGILAEKLMQDSPAAPLIAFAIYCHHGMHDSFSTNTDTFLIDSRRKKMSSLPVDECIGNFFNDFSRDNTDSLVRAAKDGAIELIERIKKYISQYGDDHGNRHFILGMYERLLISVLIDADRRDTEDFMSGGKANTDFGDMDILWRECIANLEHKISEMDRSSEINVLRGEISDMCRNAADRCMNRFILSVPTGSGKTLSSLRFALYCAQKRKKRRIIYVAPYMSITEQNAKEIRNSLGRSDIVLEHHSMVLIEDEDEQAHYDRVTEDWRVPVVVTTAVQFLNTLFSSKTSCIRRFGSLCDSVIIVDEVQALPIKVTELFCSAINFWSELEGAVFVLCSATQPCFEKLKKNSLLRATPMINDEARFCRSFVRTEIHNDTDLVARGMDDETAARYIAEKAYEHGDVLFIANTKNCAVTVFRRVSEICGDDFDVSHLSANMHPEHRRRVIERLTNNTGKPRICISTQLVEAGVNLSFRCVIRSLAGLDSVIQAAGRCNRSGEYDIGHVYIVKMDEKAEKLAHLPDIRCAQETMTFVLDQYHRYGKDGERIDDKRFIDMYFREFYRKKQGELSYHTEVNGVSTNIVEMLSGNHDLCPKQNRGTLRQSFKTAGDRFEVIEEDGKVSVIVGTDDVKSIIDEYESDMTGLMKKKQLLRALSSYTVAISEYLKKEIGPGIRLTRDGSMYVLDKRYYDDNVGVTDTPTLMEDQII